MYLLFDIDGTLIGSGHAGRRAVERALAESFGIHQPPSLRFSGRTDQFIFRAMLAAAEVPPTEENFLRLCEAYLRHLPASLAQAEGAVLPGVRELLQRLVDDGRFELGLLTGNLPASARTKLSHFELDHFFEFGIFGDHSDDRCELAAAAVTLLTDRFGPHPAERVWVIGDTAFDIACGLHIGARTLGCGTGGDSIEALRAAGAHHVLATLEETEQVMSLLAREIERL
jgi:phosphoglycolate phosphatase